jgi:anti-anti-sigma factor
VARGHGRRLAPQRQASVQSAAVNGSPEFRIEQRTDGGTVTIRVFGDVDPLTAGELDEALTAALRDGADGIAVDLGQVTYFGSDGVRALIETAAAAGKSDRSIAVTAASDIALRVLTVVGLDHLVRI